MPDLSGESNKIDLALLEGLKAGKRESYEALYKRHVRDIYKFIYYMVCQKETAEDLTQDIFIKLCKSADLYNPRKGSFSAWLHQMAKNHTLNYLRHEKRIDRDSALSEDPKKAEQILKDQYVEPKFESDEKIATEERLKIIERVKEALPRLGKRDRQLIALCTMNKLPHKEVAKILNCSVINVKVSLYRARKQLLEAIGIDPKKLSEL